MKKLRQILEEREKTEHEPLIRKIATERRADFYRQVHDRKPNRLAEYGDCGFVSHHVCKELKKYYPSAKVVSGDYVEHHRTGPQKGWDTGSYIDHTWVEIPEIKHYVRSEERRVGKECRSRWSRYH